MVREVFSHRASLQPPGVRGLIAKTDAHTPAAVGVVYQIGDVAVLNWIATVPGFRRRGLGSILTARLTNAALADGARLVALNASHSGASVYERLGYQTYGSTRWWCPPAR